MIEKKPEKTRKINGGPRPGSGRKPGTPNKRTLKTQEHVEGSGITPLDYMLSVMRDGAEEPRQRLAAAQAAAPYVHAKLSSVELTGKDGGPLETKSTIDPTKLSDAALKEILNARS